MLSEKKPRDAAELFRRLSISASTSRRRRGSILVVSGSHAQRSPDRASSAKNAEVCFDLRPPSQ
jgi:hypothetical protein